MYLKRRLDCTRIFVTLAFRVNDGTTMWAVHLSHNNKFPYEVSTHLSGSCQTSPLISPIREIDWENRRMSVVVTVEPEPDPD